MAKLRRESGFTLIEVLITLALVTVLSVLALNVLTPWLTFKQTLDTDRKLQDMRKAIEGAYSANAMTAEAQSGNTFLGLVHDTTAAGNTCGASDTNRNALTQAPLSMYLTEAGEGASKDGFATSLCFFITPQLYKDVEGVRIYYHVLGIVSTGKSGTLDAGTTFDANTGQLVLGGDNRGVVVNGFAIQYAKYRDTLERMNRVATLYESYFTTRFLNTADRDVSRDYFYSTGAGGDPAGTIPATGGWTSTVSLFSNTLGLSPLDGTSAFESAPGVGNNIEVGNSTESVTVRGQTTTVRSPASLGTGSTPPYTALLRARLPGAADNYVVRAVVGNY